MNHQGTKTLESERLVLRRFTVEDAEVFFQNVTSDPEVNKFLTWLLDESVEDTKRLLAGWVERYENPERYCWAIVLKDTEVVIGTIAAPTVKNRIEAGFDSNNPNSGRVMEKVGMKKEGLLRQAGRNNQGLFDLVFYGILKEDWLALQKG